MSGKFGDLSPEQTKALEQFRSQVDTEHIAYQSLYDEKIKKFTAEQSEKEKSSTVPPEEKKDEDEILNDIRKLTDTQRNEEYNRELIRFLRAFKWKVDQVVPHYKKYLLFKEKYNLDYLINFPLLFSPPKVELLQKLVPHRVSGYDKDGCPLYIEKSGLAHVAAVLQNFTEEEILLNHLWNQEKLVRKCLHQNRINNYYYSPSSVSTSNDSSISESSNNNNNNKSSTQEELGKKHIEQFINILDLKGLHLGHRSCLKFTKVILTTDQQFYPERLKKMYIVNAPWIFPVLWNIVKHWLDPVTREKIVVLKSNYKEELLKQFESNQLPIEYGGTAPDIPTHDISDIIKSLKEESEELELTTVKIAAGKKFIHKLDGSKDTVFGWYFKTIGHDINFSVEFIPRSGEEKDKKIIVVEAQRWSADDMGHQGTYTAPSDGTCYFIFDNSFSWMKGKEIRYNITAGEIERSLSKRHSVSNLSIHEKNHNNHNNNNDKEESKSKNDNNNNNGKNEST